MLFRSSCMITSRREILIHSDLRHVWHVLTAIPAWPSWNPDVKWARTTGPLQVGCVFVWNAGGLSITSVVQELEPPHLIVWQGNTLGMHARHHWGLDQHEDMIRVSTEETMSGWLSALLKLFRRNFLDDSLDRTLKFLKRKSEI